MEIHNQLQARMVNIRMRTYWVIYNVENVLEKNSELFQNGIYPFDHTDTLDDWQ